MLGRPRTVPLVFFAILLVAAGGVSAQAVSLTADPTEGTAPADIRLRIEADPPMQADWRIVMPMAGADQVIATGKEMPADRAITLNQAGSYTMRLEVVGRDLSAEATVEVGSNAKALALGSVQIRIDGSPSAGKAFEVHLDNPTEVEASWQLFLVAQGAETLMATGSRFPATTQATLGAEGDYGLFLIIDADGQMLIHEAGFEVGPRTYSSWVAGDVMPLLFAGFVMLALAVWLMARDSSRPINVAFAALFIARGAADIVLALWANHGTVNIRPGEGLDAATGGFARHLHPVTNILVLFAALYFLYTYLAMNSARLAVRQHIAKWASIGAAVALIALYLLVPSVWWQSAPLRPGGWLFLITGLYYPLYAVFALLLFRESVKDIPDDRRTGAFYSGLGFLFLPVFSGAGEFLFVDVLDFFGRLESAGGIARSSLGTGFEIGHWAAVLALVPALAAGWVLGRHARAEPQRRGARLHFILYLIAMVLPLLSLGVAVLVFFMGPDPIVSAGRALGAFNIFQGIWTIPYPVLVAYGIARYQVSTEQTRMRQQLRRFGLASVFFTVFFAVTEGLEAFASSRFGPAVGLGSAAGLTLMLGPLQGRLQRRVVEEVPPEAQTQQELRFYREQVRRTLIDGHIGDVERRFLLNLQATMGITDEMAASIEQTLTAEAARGGTAT